MYGASLNCRFAYPRTYLGKGGKCRSVPAACFPSRCIPPCSRRLLALWRGMMARTKPRKLHPLAHHPPRPGIMLGTPAPDTASTPHGGLSLGLLPCQRQARPTSRAASSGSRHAPLWPMQCATRRSMSALHSGLPSTEGRLQLSLQANPSTNPERIGCLNYQRRKGCHKCRAQIT